MDVRDNLKKKIKDGLGWTIDKVVGLEHIENDRNKINKARQSGELDELAWAKIDLALSEAKAVTKITKTVVLPAVESFSEQPEVTAALGAVNPVLKWGSIGWSAMEDGYKGVEDLYSGEFKAGAARLVKSASKVSVGLICMGVATAVSVSIAQIGVPAIGCVVVSAAITNGIGKIAKNPLNFEEKICKTLEESNALERSNTIGSNINPPSLLDKLEKLRRIKEGSNDIQAKVKNPSL